MGLYVFLVLLSILINIENKNALITSLVVGGSILLPICKDYGALFWYSNCILAELLVLYTIYVTPSRIGKYLKIASCMLIVSHCLGYTFDGSLPESPYRYVVVSLEYVELIICVIFSNPIIEYKLIKNRKVQCQ